MFWENTSINDAKRNSCEPASLVKPISLMYVFRTSITLMCVDHDDYLWPGVKNVHLTASLGCISKLLSTCHLRTCS